MQNLSKLQIRAKVLSVISSLKAMKPSTYADLSVLVDELSEIEDRKFLFDVFMKEYIKLNEDECMLSANVIKSLVPLDYVNEKCLEYLKSSLSDSYKYKVVQLMRTLGGDYDYAQLSDFFENPQEVLDLETKRLLDSAAFNPESMLDFLDFVSAVSERDKSLLLTSLSLDYSGDRLANIVYPILYSDFSDEFILQSIDVLVNTKSSLAIAPFEYLIEINSNEEVVKACKKGLKLLKLAGATKEKAQLYFESTIKNSQIAQIFATIPDGSGKQAILLTRKYNNAHFSVTAFVISDLGGIVDCFGFFNISEEEVIKIIKKFYTTEGKYEISKEYAKSRIEAAQNLNIANSMPYPYEYICWKPVLTDALPFSVSLEEYAKTNCTLLCINKDDTAEILSKEYTLRWFFTPDDNENIKAITDKIYSLDDYNIDYINNLLMKNIDKVFDNENIDLWKNRLYNLIYILQSNGKSADSDKFYTILNSEELFGFFKETLMQRSIFSFFVAKRESLKESFFTQNIFRKRNQSEYDSKKLDKIIDILKRSWLEQ